MLINKYKPKTLKEIIGQEKPLEELKKYVLNNKPVLIQGNVGIGKTTSIHALANDLDYEILEINAGDLRNKNKYKIL